jgi:predicted Zn-dependent protease
MSKTHGTDIRSSWMLLIVAFLTAATLPIHAIGQTSPQRDLYFVAIGDVPRGLVNNLASHFERKFGISILVLKPLRLEPTATDPERRQAVADRLIRAIRSTYPTLDRNPQARVIGITSSDMFMEALREQWKFTFSLRSSDRRFAVVSYARMDPAYFGQPPDEHQLQGRLRKMVAKNIGIMYFGLPASDNPRSALFRNVLGLDDLDRMTEEFNPK